MYQIAIIGVSGFGAVHFEDLRREVEEGHARVVAATVINQPEEAAKCAALESWGARLHEDWREMLRRHAGEVDLCFIPTGIALHAPMTIAALESGANVFVEKPLAATIQDVLAVEEAQRRTGRFVAVGFQHLYRPEILEAKGLLCAEELGPVVAARGWGVWPRDGAYYSRNAWAGRLRVGDEWVLDGPLNNAFSHCLNLLLFLSGQDIAASAVPESVTAELYRANPIESYDTGSIEILTKDGPRVFFACSHAGPRDAGPYLEVLCERGRLNYDYREVVAIQRDGAGRPVGEAPKTFDPSGTDPEFRRPLRKALRRRLSDPKVPICTTAIARTHTLAINLAHESSSIHEIPAAYLRRRVREGRTFTEIDGIEDLLRRSVERNGSLRGAGARWGRQGRSVGAPGYARFSGPRS